MPTNLNRTVIEERTVDFLQVVRFSTGAYHASHRDSRVPIFTLTNTQAIAETGYLAKLETLILDPDTFKLQSRFRGGIRLELSPKFEASLALILDSGLRPSAKLAYIVSVLTSLVLLTDETLTTLFQVRPDPLSEIEALFPPIPNTDDEALLRQTIFPDFTSPAEAKIHSDQDYRNYCLTVSFLSSPRAIRYGDFIQANQNNFFIPAYPRTSFSRGKLYAAVDRKRVEDLFPREYDRFMHYFNSGVVRELRPWARSRFDKGVETVRELKDKGIVERNAGLNEWRKVIDYLTLDEAKAFVEYITKTNGISKVYRGCSEDVASLLAYYWVEGGADKLNELGFHIVSSQENHVPGGFGAIQNITLAWRNPFADKNTRRPDLMPYVKALSDTELKTMPLEWALASYSPTA